ncbi:hypothetical protein H4R33_001406 [Dimargaris cristalligena]|nr:hypothetical protein H4R33_001406 [Dimargaris cristalligena]
MLSYLNNNVQSDIEETIQRLMAKKSVKGIVVATNEGAIVKSTVEEALSTQYTKLMTQLVQATRQSIRELDDQNDLTFLRIRTKKHEIMLSPVIQNPQEH